MKQKTKYTGNGIEIGISGKEQTIYVIEKIIKIEYLREYNVE